MIGFLFHKKKKKKKEKGLFLPKTSQIVDEDFELVREGDFRLALILLLLADVLDESIDHGAQCWILLLHLTEKMVELLRIGADQCIDGCRQGLEEIGEVRARGQHVLKERIEKALQLFALLRQLRSLSRLLQHLHRETLNGFQAELADLVIVVLEARLNGGEKERVLIEVQQTKETLGMLIAQRRDQFVIAQTDRRNLQKTFRLDDRQGDDQTVENDVADIESSRREERKSLSLGRSRTYVVSSEKSMKSLAKR